MAAAMLDLHGPARLLALSRASAIAERFKPGLPVRAAGLMSCIAAGLLPAPAMAQSFELKPFVEVYAGAGAVDVGDLEFYPGFGGITVGTFVREGIGVELHFDGGFRSDDNDNFELDYDTGYGAALRLQSPAQGGLSGYVVLGYTTFTLNQDRINPSVAGDDLSEDFGGPRISIGLVQRLERFPLLSVSAEFRKYYVEDGLDVDAFLLGIRMGVR